MHAYLLTPIVGLLFCEHTHWTWILVNSSIVFSPCPGIIFLHASCIGTVTKHHCPFVLLVHSHSEKQNAWLLGSPSLLYLGLPYFWWRKWDFIHPFNYKPPSVRTVRWGRKGRINWINKNSHFHVFIYPKNVLIMRLPYTKTGFSPHAMGTLKKKRSTWPHGETTSGWFDWQVSGIERLHEKSQRDKYTNARI